MPRVKNLHPAIPSDLGIAHVIGERADGIVVVKDESGTEIACEVLFSPGLEATFSSGDRVLVFRSSEGSLAVILGRIGRVGANRSADLPAELILRSRSRLQLSCQDASIELRGDGKVAVKGRDLVSRAQRTNRVKGGSVAIN